ncbi:MAG: hypothetical protein ABI559_04595 [Chloroflexota bacterium]
MDADYTPDPVSAKRVERAVAIATRFLTEVETIVATIRVKESEAIYGDATLPRLAKPEDYVELVRQRILATYPDTEFQIDKRSAKRFTLIAYTDLEDKWDIQDAMGDLRGDIHVQHGVWIVLSPRLRHPEDD